MRKYQQLTLLLVSCFSISVLLMYKSENNRLKYVLQVVNFFGRSDMAVLRRIDNGTKDIEIWTALSKPTPVWQMIGDSFHAYSAYWNRNELVVGGEARAIVISKQGAVINFQCHFNYDRDTRIIQGKFSFQHSFNESIVYSATVDKSREFTSYNFFCRLTRNFGNPESVTFIDRTSQTPNPGKKLRLRYLKPINSTINFSTYGTVSPLTVCVDLVNYNMSSKFARKDNYLLQFFLFHHALGIGHFIVYNFDELPERVVQLLRHTNLHLHQLPFNFPFKYKNSNIPHLRQLIETDCLLRNINQARHTLLLAPNEFFYPNANGLLKYQDLRYELTTFAVCIDDTHKLLMDNTQYDSELIAPHKLLLYGLNGQLSKLLTQQTLLNSLPLSAGFVHRYVQCQNIGQDGVHDWRNSVREEFMNHITAVRNEVDLLI